MDKIPSKEFKKKLLAREHLREGLVVSESLYLNECTSLTHLPEGLVVSGNLDLKGCTSLTHLPEGLVVSESLYLQGCTSLTHLPEGLVVSGYLYLDTKLIDSIPVKSLPIYLDILSNSNQADYFFRKITQTNQACLCIHKRSGREDIRRH